MGGIAGSCSSSEISNCTNNGKVIGVEQDKNSIIFGGIVGSGGDNSVIYLCYNNVNIGNLEAEMAQIGGIAGTLSSNSTISSCFNLKEITGQTAIGGIVGLMGYRIDCIYR